MIFLEVQVLSFFSSEMKIGVDQRSREMSKPPRDPRWNRTGACLQTLASRWRSWKFGSSEELATAELLGLLLVALLFVS